MCDELGDVRLGGEAFVGEGPHAWGGNPRISPST